MARIGNSAREALIEQAERLFAERGIEGVSLRDVSAAAGQRNHSAAQYHFGDRAGLVAAVYDARMSAVNERRERHLRTLEAGDRLDDVLGLVEAIVVPLVEIVTTTDSWYARFLAQARWDRVAAHLVAELPAAATMRVVTRHLMRALAPLPTEVRRSRVEQLYTLIVGTMAGWEWARHNGERHLSAADVMDELISTGLAVVTAPHALLPRHTAAFADA